VGTEVQRKALSLFREANASNNDYLAFLFFWQVLEIDGTHPHNFINKTFSKRPRGLRLDQWDLNNLPLRDRSLGNYLQEHCRHAIAHITRQAGLRALDLDERDERFRLAISTRVVKAFAEYYVLNALGLNDHLHLVRHKKNDFPIYVDRQTLWTRQYRPAYAAPKLRLPRRTLEKSRRQIRNESAAT
jgi:Methylamine utilization protein MauJ